MIRRVVCLLAALGAAGSARAQQHVNLGYAQVFEELRVLAPRADRVAAVEKLVLRRDVAEFRLEQGSLVLLTSVAGRTVGAAFVGAGTLSLVPPLAIERAHLRRVLGDSVLDTPITAAVFLFADSTPAELERAVAFGDGSVPADVRRRVGDALEFLIDGRERRADPTLMTALLNSAPNGYFAAYVKRQRGEGVMIRLDPHEIEEVMLLRRGRLTDQRVETVCQFQRARDLQDSVAAVDEQPLPLRLDAYRIEATIKGNLDFSAVATVRLTADRDNSSWARFLLFDELDVDSVIGSAGTPATFFRAKGSTDLWARFQPPLRAGETDSIRIVYHGDLIAHGSLMDQFLPPITDPRRRQMWSTGKDRWALIRSTSTWYPRYSFWQASDMDLTFHTPKNLQFASIGRQVDSRVQGDVRTTRWITEVPTQQASFNLGDFEEFQITDPRIPPVTVHVNAEAHFRLAEFFMGQRDPQVQVGRDLANSLAFFSNVFGPPLFQRYYATEIPHFHGQAFPGLIHLSWWTFQSTRETGFEEIFRAHEMAHQWWGIGVEPADYRDAWLSEGFAMFAGLWYMQLILRDNEKYFKQLREWRSEIRSKREKTAPLGLGYRVLQSDPEHYDLMVYRKGAWVLHMLRNLMLDVRTMDEAAFSAMMKDFYQRYRGRRASTRDFQRVVEEHVGRPMAWFFDQWVDGTAIPTYTLAWKAERRSDGQHVVRLRVRQSDVPDEFRMSVPLFIELADGERLFVRLDVRGPLTEAELPLSAEPKSVELNPLESVLAEVKQEGWR